MFSTIRSIALGVNEAIKSLTGGEFAECCSGDADRIFRRQAAQVLLDTVITRVLSLKGHLGGIAGGLGGGLLGVVGGGLGLAAASAVNPFSGGKEGEGGGGMGGMVGSLVFDAVAMALGGKLVGGLGRKTACLACWVAPAPALSRRKRVLSAQGLEVFWAGLLPAADPSQRTPSRPLPVRRCQACSRAPVVATGIAGLFASPVSSPDRARGRDLHPAPTEAPACGIVDISASGANVEIPGPVIPPYGGRSMKARSTSCAVISV